MKSESKFGRSMGGLLVLLLALAAGALIALSPDIALPMLVLLLPGVLALILDRSPGCGVATAILLFQAAACVHPVISAWYSCSGIDGCMNYLADWQSILPVWLAGAAAWLMTQILPIGLKILDDYRMRHRGAVLVERRRACRHRSRGVGNLVKMA